MIVYLLESAICLAVFYGFYHLFLRHLTFFQWNRAYLLTTAFLAVVIPALHIPVALEQPALENSTAVEQPVFTQFVGGVQRMPQAMESGLATPLSSVWTLSDVLWALYWIGALLLSLRLLVHIYRLIRLIRRPEKSQAASFFGIILGMPESEGAEAGMIRQHEETHARQWHSLDVLFMEALLIVQWFNPLMFAYRRSLMAVHEYIADDEVINGGAARLAYAQLLVKQQTREPRARPALVNTFHSLIKQRLIMLARRPTKPLKRLGYLFAIPMLAATFLLFSFRLIENLPLAKPLKQAIQSIEEYAHALGEINIVASKRQAAEPTPYRFYWGSVSCIIYHDKEEDRYFGEANSSVEELQAMLKREPRVYNGHGLEQKLSFTLEGMTLNSDYNNPEVYAVHRKALDDFIAETPKNTIFTLENLSLPNGKTAEIRLVLDQKAPSWAPKGKYEISSLNNPKEAFSIGSEFKANWGNESLRYEADREFYTVDEFWKILYANLELEMPEGVHLVVEQEQVSAVFPNKKIRIDSFMLSLMCFNLKTNSSFIRLRDGESSRMTLRQLRQTLEEVRAQLVPETGILVFLNLLTEGEVDTLYDAQRNVVTTAPRRAFPGRQLATFHLVPDGDPRLALRNKMRKDYDLRWGSVQTRFYRKFARRFEQNDGTFVYADSRQSGSHFITQKEFQQVLSLKPRLLVNDEEVSQLRFVLRYKGRDFEAGSEGLSARDISYLQNQVQPRDKITISELEASGIALQNCQIDLEISAPDPKAALPDEQYYLQWGAGTYALGGRRKGEGQAVSTQMGALTLADCREMLQQQPQIRFHDKAVGKFGFQLYCDGHSYDCTEKGFSEKQARKIAQLFAAGKTLRLSAFNADGIALTPVNLYLYRNDDSEGSNNRHNGFSLNISPNPMKRNALVHFALPAGEQGKLFVVTSDGRRVFSLQQELSGEGDYNITLSNISEKGLYWMTLEGKNGKISKPVIVE